LISKHDRQDRTVWGNFRHDTTEMCRLADPEVGLLFSFRRVIQTLLLYYSGLLPFTPISETHFEVPMPSVLAKLGVRPLVAAALDRVLMRPQLFRHLRARGIHVYVWVLNTEEEFARAFGCGVSGVMTDFPLRLRQFLDANPQYL
jgi:glycerophosphoryl diester phosphodiesterase